MSRVLVVSANFYQSIADEMVRGATDALKSVDVNYDLINVPGAFEIPGAIRFALHAKKYDGYVALGCVIRGETTHYDYVCKESARALMDLALHHQAALGFGILTVENEEQAWARADIKRGNKGKDAVDAALRMIELKRQFGVSA